MFRPGAIIATLLAGYLILPACGPDRDRPQRRTLTFRTVTPDGSNSSGPHIRTNRPLPVSETTPQRQFRITVERPTLDNITRPEALPELPPPPVAQQQPSSGTGSPSSPAPPAAQQPTPATGLRANLDGVRISESYRNTRLLITTVRIAGQNVLFEVERPTGQRVVEATSRDGRFQIQLTCISPHCDQAYLRVNDRQSQEQVDVRYRQTTEFLTTGPRRMSLRNNDRVSSIIQDAIEYRLPVQRHRTQVLNGRESDRLVIARPPVDIPEPESEQEAAESADAPEATTAPAEAPPLPTAAIEPALPTLPTEDDTVEVEAGEFELPLPPAAPPEPPPTVATPTPPQRSNTDTQARNTPGQPRTPRVNPPGTAVPGTQGRTGPLHEPPREAPAELVLTPDPWRAYNIQIPPELFPGGREIRDPTALPSSFAITPANLQQPLEPSHRLLVMAKAMVDQNVRIFRNGCNIYARAALTLAGYTHGGTYLANDFEMVFRTNNQGLNTWDRNPPNQEDGAAARNVLVASLRNIPEGYAVVLQTSRKHLTRNGRPRHGHVSIIAKEHGQLVKYDSSFNQYPPRRASVTPESLLREPRVRYFIYSIPSLYSGGTPNGDRI